MVTIRSAFLAFFVVLAGIAPASAGPVTLSGHDADDHGFESAYAGLFSALLQNVTNGRSGIVAIGADPGTTAGRWVARVASFMTPSQSVTFVNGSGISSVDFSQFAIVHVPSDSADTFGGITPNENALLVARAKDIADFINAGGGLFGLTQGQFTNAYGYLSFFGTISSRSVPPSGRLPSGQLYDNVTATAAGQDAGITNTNIDGCCWHNVFTGFPSFLAVLASANEPADPAFHGQAAVLGGATVRVGQPAFGIAGGAGRPWGVVADPVNTATGNYVTQRTDLAIPGRGIPAILTRTYNSLDNFVGPFGRGWTHSYNIRLTDVPGGPVIVKQGDGQEEFYDPVGGGEFTSRFPGVFSKLVENSDGTFVLTLTNQTQYRFSAGGLLTSITDRNGNALTFGYDGAGNLVTIADTVGRVISLAYASGGRLTQVTDPIGRMVRYDYDAAGNLTAVTDPNGGVTTYAYDSNERLTEIRDERGILIVENVYDSVGRVAAQTNGRGFTTAFSYASPDPEDTTVVDPLGNTLIHTHDTDLRLVEITDANGGVVRFTYDDDNNRTSITDQNGRLTAFAYDDRGNVTSITDPLGNVIAFSYEATNDLASATNARGLTTAFSYDANGNLTNIQDALGNTTTFAYDALGQLAERTDARGNATRYAYDAQGNVTGIADALGGATDLAYDGVGRLIGLTDPNGNTSGAGYDANNRLIRITGPLGNRTDFLYDPAGNLVEIVDAKGHRTQYGYDEANNLADVTDALGNVTRYSYDANNNRIGLTDANGNPTAFAFDALNRLAAVTDPLGNATTYQYDAAGNVIAVVDATGTTSAFAYDANNRLTEIAYGDGSSVAYAYDADGNRTRMEDEQGTTTYAYDDFDRLVEVDHTSGAVDYAYDGVGNRTSLTFPDGRTATYKYDALNRLTRVTDWTGQFTTYGYDAASNLLHAMYPNATATSYRYDAANRLIDVTHRGNHRGDGEDDDDGDERDETEVLARFAYLLDALGNRVEVRRSGDALRPPFTASLYSYDALSQLTAVEDRRSGRPRLLTELAYDPVGNRLSLTESRFRDGKWRRGTMTDYAYDAANRLLQAGDTAFTYDPNGNRITEFAPGGVDRVYTYDTTNRLIEVDQGWASDDDDDDDDDKDDDGISRVRIGYTYDGDGNKVERSAHAARHTETVAFLNDVATALPVVLREERPEDSVRYLYGLALIADERTRLWPSDDDDDRDDDDGDDDDGGFGRSFYHADGLGSTVLVTDPEGDDEANFAYDAWGNLLRDGSASTRFLFTGEEQDPQTGLYYLRARWYDPRVGQFLSRDPFKGFAYMPRTANAYDYVLNNPVRFRDPSGLALANGGAPEAQSANNSVFSLFDVGQQATGPLLAIESLRETDPYKAEITEIYLYAGAEILVNFAAAFSCGGCYVITKSTSFVLQKADIIKKTPLEVEIFALLIPVPHEILPQAIKFLTKIGLSELIAE